MRKSPIRQILQTPALLCAALSIVVAIHAQNSTTPCGNAQSLIPDSVLPQCYLETSVTHTYQLKLEAQQFARIVVEQKGVDAVVKIIAPDDSTYRQVDNPNGLYGPETVSILGQTAGVYRLEISANPGTPAGNYELRVEGPRQTSDLDNKYVTAESTFAEAKRLRGVEDYKAAIQKYEEAIALWRELNDKRLEGYSLTNEGRVYRLLSEPSQALDRLAEALRRLEETGDISGQAFTLNEIGAVHRNFGDAQDAIAAYEKAVKLRLEINDRFGQAQLYNNIGLSYSNMGYQPQAAENLEKSSSIWRDLGVRNEEMNTLINAAKAHAEMGDLTFARSQYQTVLDFCDQQIALKNSPLLKFAINLRPYALNGLGLVNDTWDPDEARARYNEALDGFRKNRDDRGEADVLDNLGLLHAFLSDTSQALDYFKSALVLREQMKEPKGWGATLSNIGFTYTLQGKHDDALRQLELALPLCRRARDKRFEAYTLTRMGMAYVALNKPVQALESYQKALTIQQDPAFADQRGQAITLDKMGEALALSGEPARALEVYQSAIQRWIEVGDAQGQALSLYGVAQIERNRHNLANARDRIDEAIKLVEKLRSRVTARQLQMIYFAGKQDLYALAIDVRIQLYELTKSNADLEGALSLSEQSRARNLIDLLAAARVDLSKSMSSEDAEKNIKLQEQISALTQTHLRLLSEKAKKDAAAAVFETLKSRIREQDDLVSSVTRRGSSNGTQPASPLTPQQIQQLLDDKTVVLEFSLGEERSHLWTITQSSLNYYGLPAGAEIQKAADKLSQALIAYEPKRRSNESGEEFTKRLRLKPDYYLASALDLSRMVLGKVWPQLGDKRLVIVADGPLQYIPFEVLPAPDSSSNSGGPMPLLVAKNEIVYQPSASALGFLRGVVRPNSSKTVAVFADPVFSDDDDRVQSALKPPSGKTVVNRSREKLTRSLRDVGDDDFTLSKLAFSLKEANAITAIAPRGSWLKKVGFDANREAATSPSLKQFSIVHFATHGFVNDKQPELSGIALSMVNKRGQEQDGYLTLHDIYYLDLPIRLVVVSACRTGIGKQVPGEGLIALTRGFMHAGAQAMIVSLWDVDDEATAEFMTRFYDQMLGKNKLPPAAALRQAKAEMQAHANERWRAPYYWAGFILQGDWQ